MSSNHNNDHQFGRPHSEWDALLPQGHRFLVERARLSRHTSYTEMNDVVTSRAHVRRFDFSHEIDRAGMGYLLGLIVAKTFPELEFMLSALVIYLNDNDAGDGFYKLASEMGLLRATASKAQREAFWVAQLNAAYSHFGRQA
jgi:hypothetical protein